MKSKEDAPAIAVVSADTLVNLGLAGLLESLAPAVRVSLFASFRELAAAADPFVHYFVSLGVLASNPAFFARRSSQTIVLCAAHELADVPLGYRALETDRPEAELACRLLSLQQTGHGDGRRLPPGVARAWQQAPEQGRALTARETEVLRCLALGLINKEIADRLHISLTTVITHRKNMVRKLGIRSVSGLTIYAVTRRIVSMEEIR